MRLLLASALGLGLGISGCGRAPMQEASAPHAQVTGVNTPPSFLDQIASAPFQTAYRAQRRVWQAYKGASGPETLEYTETVYSDGQAHFSVTTEHVSQPALSSQAEQIFKLTQKSREGFIYRLRDFRIQQLDSFLLAYRVQDLNQQLTVAGEACERLRITSANQPQTYWELDVDVSTKRPIPISAASRSTRTCPPRPSRPRPRSRCWASCRCSPPSCRRASRS